jgi:hypothetical protein
MIGMAELEPERWSVAALQPLMIHMFQLLANGGMF